jgi:hypothetical protein
MSTPAANAFSDPVMAIAPIPGGIEFGCRRCHYGHRLPVERVERLRPVQRDRGYTSVALDKDGLSARLMARRHFRF